MNNVKIHPLSDVQSLHIGEGTSIWQYVVILENAVLGSDCNINCHTFIENNVHIGNRVTVKSGIYIWDGIDIEDDVFLGPNVTFINDKYPRSKHYPNKFLKTTIKKGVSIGANATILGGLEIGEYSLIGAGSVVTKNVKPYTLVVGNPAREIGLVNKDGEIVEKFVNNTNKIPNMTICIAGKNEIAIDITLFIKKHYPEVNILGIVNASDSGINDSSRSFKWFLEFNKIKEVKLEDVYSIPDLLFLSLEFDKIIDPQNFISNRLFNIHFSYLPAYKGMFTSAWPILNCEIHSGVTLHEINAGIDTGDILDKVKFILDSKENAQTLYKKYLQTGTDLVRKNIQSLIANKYTKIRQSASGSTYYSKKSIDYKNLKIKLNVTACQLDVQIRAFTYREYQLPNVHGFNIIRSEITDKQSLLKPGKIFSQNDEYIEICTIDFDVKLFIDKFDEFIKASHLNDIITTKRLLQLINIEEKTNKGWTPLIVACYNNSIDVAEFLLASGANVNAINYNGTSVLMYAKDAAIRVNDNKILELVMSYVPDIHCKDFSNNTVFDYLKNQSIEITEFIKMKYDDKVSGYTEDK